ncbi:MAG: hypothetical protein R6X19_08120 [Kiritimatiellia bacterium]
MGQITARRLIEAGYAVPLAELDPEAGRAAETELGPSARFVQTDAGEEASARRCGSTASARAGSM